MQGSWREAPEGSHFFTFHYSLFTIITPPPRRSAVPVSLRLGHGAALTAHRAVIHSRADASRPSSEGADRIVPLRLRMTGSASDNYSDPTTAQERGPLPLQAGEVSTSEACANEWAVAQMVGTGKPVPYRGFPFPHL